MPLGRRGSADYFQSLLFLFAWRLSLPGSTLFYEASDHDVVGIKTTKRYDSLAASRHKGRVDSCLVFVLVLSLLLGCARLASHASVLRWYVRRERRKVRVCLSNPRWLLFQDHFLLLLVFRRSPQNLRAKRLVCTRYAIGSYHPPFLKFCLKLLTLLTAV